MAEDKEIAELFEKLHVEQKDPALAFEEAQKAELEEKFDEHLKKLEASSQSGFPFLLIRTSVFPDESRRPESRELAAARRTAERDGRCAHEHVRGEASRITTENGPPI